MISISYDDGDIRQALDRIVRAVGNPAPALKAIGETVAGSTKERFRDSKGPDGTPWAANSEATMQAYLAKFSGVRTKKGNLSKRGETLSTRKKPLIGETKALASTIFYEMIGETAVAVGSPMVYSAMQQFGGAKGEFPNLWGDIPARPFLGLSEADKADIMDDLTRYLNRAITG